MNKIEQLSTDLTYEAAVALDEKVDRWHEQGHKLAIEAYKGRIWLQLGYDSWDAYCETKRHAFGPALDREARREVVGEMRDAGMSTRAIGTALGVNQATVVRDLPRDANASPDEAPKITGKDGKQYAATPPPVRVDPFSPLPSTLVNEEEREAVERQRAEVLARAEAEAPDKEELRQRRVATDLIDAHVNPLALLCGSAGMDKYRVSLSSRPMTLEKLDKAEECIRQIRKALIESGELA